MRAALTIHTPLARRAALSEGTRPHVRRMRALIAITIIAAVTALGLSVRDVFGNSDLTGALS